jgi:phosphopantetheine binding protein
MVPALYVPLAQLPLTVSGKLDRQALPAPETPLQLGRAYVVPRTSTEFSLQAILSDTLHIARVGIDDNLFDLGANSLTLLRILEKLNAWSLRHLTPIDILTYPRIRDLANYIDNGRTRSGTNTRQQAESESERPSVRGATNLRMQR